MKKALIPLVLLSFIISCSTEYSGIPEKYHSLLDTAFLKAGDNAEELSLALSGSPRAQKEGMAFIISFMPERDLISLKADFLLENAKYAYKARNEFPWCAELPDSIFLNEVLPYANTTEDRDPWREDYYNRFSKYVDTCDNIVDAIFAVNNNIMEEVGVEYNTKRSRVDASPKQSMAEGMATCTGLSIMLTDAFRSVGIPSRLAGTGMWTNMKGNHTWSEVWVDGDWMFTEYSPDTLNQSWFVADAGKADPENPIHWIYAVSYKPTGMYYGAGTQAMHLINEVDESQIPERWKSRLERMKEYGRNLPEPYVWGYNVTGRYIDIYRQQMENKQLADDECIANVVVYRNENSVNSQGRISCLVEVYLNDEKIDFGYSPSRLDDDNNFLKFRLKKNTPYKFIFYDEEQENEANEVIIETNEETEQEYKVVLGKES